MRERRLSVSSTGESSRLPDQRAGLGDRQEIWDHSLTLPEAGKCGRVRRPSRAFPAPAPPFPRRNGPPRRFPVFRAPALRARRGRAPPRPRRGSCLAFSRCRLPNAPAASFWRNSPRGGTEYLNSRCAIAQRTRGCESRNRSGSTNRRGGDGGRTAGRDRDGSGERHRAGNEFGPSRRRHRCRRGRQGAGLARRAEGGRGRQEVQRRVADDPGRFDGSRLVRRDRIGGARRVPAGSTFWSTTPVSARIRSAPTGAATRSDFGKSRRSNGAALSRSMRRRP